MAFSLEQIFLRLPRYREGDGGSYIFWLAFLLMRSSCLLTVGNDVVASYDTFDQGWQTLITRMPGKRSMH